MDNSLSAPVKGNEFTEEQALSAYPDGIEDHWWNKARNMMLRRIILRFSSRDGRVLDVGCGRGISVAYLRKYNINCTGVDLGKCPAIKAAKKYVQVSRDVKDLPLNERLEVKTLLLMDILEHIEVPGVFLKDLIRYFPRTSMIIGSVPAFQSLWSNYDVYYGHMKRYSLKDVEQLCVNMGPEFRLVLLKYAYHSLYPVLGISNRLGSPRRLHYNPPVGISRLVHHLLAGLFYTEFIVLPGRLAGSSLLFCMKRYTD